MNRQKIVSDFFLMKIPVKECGEKLVALGDYAKDILIDLDPLTKKNEKFRDTECYVRESVAIMLAQVQGFLHPSYRLKITDGFKSLETQKKLYAMVFDDIKSNNPEWSVEKIKKEVDKWVANPLTVPPHTTGGAVDVTLVTPSGKEMDMGTTLNAISEKCFTFCKDISQQAQNNRALLINVMKKVGFVNYPGEWWHWCYGDRMWAYYTKNSYALYEGLTNSPIRNVKTKGIKMNKHLILDKEVEKK
ncbi:MAG: M15 family metallopeptidase [Nanoarchaeota archaeon]